MRVAVGSDHAGFLLKENLKEYLDELGHEVLDLGTDSLSLRFLAPFLLR